jgi:hypothetical protein
MGPGPELVVDDDELVAIVMEEGLVGAFKISMRSRLLGCCASVGDD